MCHPTPGYQPLPKAEAERPLEAVSRMPWFGRVLAHQESAPD